MACYLGVDGGGSKTAFALLDDTGRVVARAAAPASYYFGDGIAIVEKALAQGVSEICAQAGIHTPDIDAAFFGIPGYGEASGDIEQLDAVPGRVLGHDRYSCDNDMVCGWAGSLAGADGINVISGTGSMAYGQRHGTGGRAGGWGELFGDEGSAYWIATQGLNAFSRMSDGRLTRGPLYTLLKERLQLAGDLDAVSLVIDTWAANRRSIAALATTVCAAARTDDVASVRILSAAAGELVALVETTGRQIGFAEQEVVPVSYSGGMFTDENFLALFAAALRKLPANYDLRPPLLDPAVGAALYAAKHSGHPLSARSLDRLAGTRTSSEEVKAP
ncbi:MULTISPECIES: N-acetylglucosamine kinase [unclassified Mycolicibacterium]|uniref:N-acetylglucosamine kinase n=1 Tax=unclassified Mycolicibacterium TaxID=2636767 RepID=UPI0012DF7D10|nr:MULTISPECIES: BadF/BadG/BcrA/BcrD ATPase family protein [unclassified Mycolicibacterium]MUL83020.1 N-acetylglucosamine kinase [Mycolicibacterium sp. CBMA 329]MUL89355.1 N-acetylglucosamine kinase [Mycolicibacterium sp. CBMA 331]MUL99044.1 N-acetylglucosamine kinase [Mycolicibacterium sp. CBMA 334]MUM30176.1 N-acetylglucosamine kinase [Mycolicibacterium sp. CBMA 295]MUM38871.1 N-acetylglucosamine kinase [Mycolicibacterium sp. CBMA 247]